MNEEAFEVQRTNFLEAQGVPAARYTVIQEQRGDASVVCGTCRSASHSSVWIGKWNLLVIVRVQQTKGSEVRSISVYL